MNFFGISNNILSIILYIITILTLVLLGIVGSKTLKNYIDNIPEKKRTFLQKLLSDTMIRNLIIIGGIFIILKFVIDPLFNYIFPVIAIGGSLLEGKNNEPSFTENANNVPSFTVNTNNNSENNTNNANNVPSFNNNANNNSENNTNNANNVPSFTVNTNNNSENNTNNANNVPSFNNNANNNSENNTNNANNVPSFTENANNNSENYNEDNTQIGGKKKIGRPKKQKSVAKVKLGKTNKWAIAVKRARKALGLTGFVPLNKGSLFYKTAKSFYYELTH